MTLSYNTLSPEEWAYLRGKVNWTVHALKDFAYALEKSLLVISAYDKKQFVGMGRITGDNKLSFFIQDVIVIPDYQKQGIGTQIVNALLDYINIQAVPSAVVSIMASKGKEKFYSKIGFSVRDGNNKGLGMELIIYPN